MLHLANHDFVHLHVHSHYSLLDGTCRIPDLVARAREFGMSHLALTDHGNLFGAVEFILTCREAGLTPIVGMEAYLAPGSRFDRPRGARGSWPHLLLLAASNTGYRNLVALASAGYIEGFYYKPRIDMDLLAAHAEGLIGMSACLSGEINRVALEGRPEDARTLILRYQEIFGKDRFFLEIMRHGLPEQEALLKVIPALSRDTGAPMAATCDVHYLTMEDARAHEVHLCINTAHRLDDARRMRMGADTFYFRSTAEMQALFAEFPEALLMTRRIAERCTFDLAFEGECLPAFTHEGAGDNTAFFRQLCAEGFRRRYPAPTARASERLAHEMATIQRMGYVDYFLIVWDFIRYARERGIPVGPGRGSAAGSVVAYCLGITQLDPLRYDLLFERFLNDERVSMPDIDIDFCMDRRGEVIDYVKRRYGDDRVCQIITFGRMAARQVIRDVGRVLNVPLKEVDALCKKIPSGPGVTLQKAFAEEPELAQLAEKTPLYRELFAIARRLEGVNRNCGTHAAGVVIGDRPLKDFVPLYRSGDVVTTQYAMEYLEKLGLMKMDFLGLRTLTIIDHACALVKQHHGVDVVFDCDALDDKPTYDLLCRGEAVAVFQLESSGMRELLKRMAPDRFEDLIALLALYRPGPLRSGMDKAYVRRKHGEEDVSYPHELIAATLQETNGVILYQEQVMRIANTLAGFSLNDADRLRKAMGKKRPQLMAQFRSTFMQGAAAQGIDAGIATRVFDLMEEFAGYGFNKSHSAAYALLSYQTAYLKANWPAEFMAAVLSSELGTTEKVAGTLEECRRMRLPILPPDVNVSEDRFTVADGRIVYALAAVKNVGIKAAREIAACRRRLPAGRFTSLEEFAGELGTQVATKTLLEHLVKAGAFDGFTPERARVYAAIEHATARAAARSRERAAGQLSFDDLLAGDGALPVRAPSYPEAPPWSELQKLAHEKEVLGLYLTGHPLRRHHALIESLSVCPLDKLERIPPGRVILVAGQVAALRTTHTRKGERMAFVTLEDLSGQADLVVFPECFQKTKDLLAPDALLFVTARVEMRNDARSLLAEAVTPFDTAPQTLSRSVAIRLDLERTNEQMLFALKRILADHPGPCPVQLVFNHRDREQALDVEAHLAVNPDSTFLDEVASLVGDRRVRLQPRLSERVLSA